MKLRDRSDELFNMTLDEQRAHILIGGGNFLQEAIRDNPIT